MVQSKCVNITLCGEGRDKVCNYFLNISGAGLQNNIKLNDSLDSGRHSETQPLLAQQPQYPNQQPSILYQKMWWGGGDCNELQLARGSPQASWGDGVPMGLHQAYLRWALVCGGGAQGSMVKFRKTAQTWAPPDYAPVKG